MWPPISVQEFSILSHTRSDATQSERREGQGRASVDKRSGAVILLRRGVEAEKQLESLVDASEFA